MADLPEVPPGANMEDCPRCPDPNPDYPFICPGHPAETVDQRIKELESAASDTDRLRRDWVELRDRAEKAEALLEEVRVYAQYHAAQCEGYCCDHAPKLLALVGEPEAQICELPHATIEEEEACERNRLARTQTPQEGTT